MLIAELFMGGMYNLKKNLVIFLCLLMLKTFLKKDYY